MHCLYYNNSRQNILIVIVLCDWYNILVHDKTTLLLFCDKTVFCYRIILS